MDNDLHKRDYNVEDVEEDGRFKRCRKEMLFTQIFGTFLLILSIVLSYILGAGNPKDYKYLAGYPAWYIYALGVLFIGTISGIVFSWKFMERSNLDAVINKKKEESI